MKVFIVLALVQAAMFMAVANGQVISKERTGRILATYSQQATQNTAAALGKLDNVTHGVGNVATGISDLTNSLNVSNSAILTKLDGIDASLKNGSEIVHRLDTVGATLDKVLTALTDVSDNKTVPGQLSLLHTFLESKLVVLEKILGYDDYPSATTTAASTTTPASG